MSPGKIIFPARGRKREGKRDRERERESGKRARWNSLRAWTRHQRDLSIIIGASWVAPNQTRGLIEVHFPERGKRERGQRGERGRLSGLSSPGIKLLLQTLGDEESADVDDVGGDGEGGGDGGGGDGILSVAKLKYRAKVCTLDNAGARVRTRAFSLFLFLSLFSPRFCFFSFPLSFFLFLSAAVNIEIRKL